MATVLDAKNTRWLGASLVGAALVAACGARSSLSLPPEGTGGAGGTSASTSASSTTSSSASSVSSSVSSSASSSSSSGNACPPPGCAVCSDGTREGFVDVVTYPGIAGCSGGWTVAGVISAASAAPACGRVSGNSSSNPSGHGCSVADLCAVGSHVCTSAAEVAALSPTGCTGSADTPGLFFATRQSGTGCGVCSLGTGTDPNVCNSSSCAMGCAQTMATANDLFGCGSLGLMDTECGALTETSANLCSSLGPPWSCTNSVGEALDVTKAGSDGGGVLCCVD